MSNHPSLLEHREQIKGLRNMLGNGLPSRLAWSASIACSVVIVGVTMLLDIAYQREILAQARMISHSYLADLRNNIKIRHTYHNDENAETGRKNQVEIVVTSPPTSVFIVEDFEYAVLDLSAYLIVDGKLKWKYMHSGKLVELEKLLGLFEPLEDIGEADSGTIFLEIEDGGLEFPMYRLSRMEKFVSEFGRSTTYIYGILISSEPYIKKMSSMRANIYILMGILVLVTGLAAYVGAKWQLRPLSRLTQEVDDIDFTNFNRVGEHPKDPMEILVLAGRINEFVDSEKKRQTIERNRHTQIIEEQEVRLSNMKIQLKTIKEGERGSKHSMSQLMDIIASLNFRFGSSADEMIWSETWNQLRNLVIKESDIFSARARMEMMQQPQDVVDILEKLQMRHGVRFPDKSVSIASSVVRSKVWVTQSDLLEMVGNLFDNAAKYGREPIRVSVEESSEYTLVVVRDCGIGFPARVVKNIMDREEPQWGVRGYSGESGYGYGLPFVKCMAHVLGGRLELKCSEIDGACAILKLPLVKPENSVVTVKHVE